MDITNLEKNAANATSSGETSVKFLIDTLYVYQQGNDKALGYLGYVLSKSDLAEDKTSPSGFKPSASTLSMVKRIKGIPNGILALMGGTWEKDYKDAKPDAYKLTITSQDDNELGHRIFFKSGGRDIPFPVTVKKNDKGQWKVVNGLSTICMDVRKTKSAAGDF